jgi:hypothetical protein
MLSLLEERGKRGRAREEEAVCRGARCVCVSVCMSVCVCDGVVDCGDDVRGKKLLRGAAGGGEHVQDEGNVLVSVCVCCCCC